LSCPLPNFAAGEKDLDDDFEEADVGVPFAHPALNDPLFEEDGDGDDDDAVGEGDGPGADRLLFALRLEWRLFPLPLLLLLLPPLRGDRLLLFLSFLVGVVCCCWDGELSGTPSRKK